MPTTSAASTAGPRDVTETAQVQLDGEVTWTVAGSKESTLTFTLLADNDVNQGDEGVPANATPAYPAPGDILITAMLGTAANDLVQLDGAAKLPAVDGSQLTNLPGGGGAPTAAQVFPLLPGGFTGYGSINTSNYGGNIRTDNHGGNIYASSYGGTITTAGHGGYINTSGSGGFIRTDNFGGSINTRNYGGLISTANNGGLISTANNGGPIITSNHGGHIYTSNYGLGINTTGYATTTGALLAFNGTNLVPITPFTALTSLVTATPLHRPIPSHRRDGCKPT